MTVEPLASPTFLVTCAAGWEQRAREELRRILPGAQIEPLFLKGNLLVTCQLSANAALDLLSQADTETLGRIFPLQVKCTVGKGHEYLETLAQASDLLPGPSPIGSFRVKCQRRGDHEWDSREAERAVGMRLEARTGAPFSLLDPQQIVAVEVFQDLAFLGVAWVDELVRKQIRRMRKYAPGERPLNRAELKLREIIQRFGLELPREGRALDIGAAPGGWTKVLAEHVAEVVAVDPGALDDSVLALPNVIHLRVRSEALLQMPDIGRFDIVTNDMNMDPAESARLLCDLAPLLKPGALAVMTVKFVTRRQRQHVQEALDGLAPSYQEARIARVPHNARETTLVARKR